MPPFTASDLDLARALYQGISAHDRALLDWFVDHPDVQREAFQLAGDLGWSPNSEVARSAYAIGEVAASLGRARPWSEGQNGYRMPAETAELFASARG